ncbi:MAG TPA: hypothetical protein VEW46_25650 [Pyrinomonadaceae bacterium]|nr:hypothetical protein [Pyrinomonadaceae bacterium]
MNEDNALPIIIAVFVFAPIQSPRIHRPLNEKLFEGWSLQGGVTITTIPAAPDKPGQQPQEAWVMWAQALVRDRKSD